MKIVEDGEEKEVEGVFCTDVEGLAVDLIQSRDIHPDLHDVHIGLDRVKHFISIYGQIRSYLLQQHSTEPHHQVHHSKRSLSG